jgi:large conductance mechanosensitive channel
VDKKTEEHSAEEETKTVVRHEKEVTIVLPAVRAPKFLQGFVDFVREQGVVGLAIGLILGFASKSVVDSLVNNIFNPIVGLLTGGISLEHKTACLRNSGGQCTTLLKYGQFISDVISFIIVVAAVYLAFKILKLERLDKKKDEEKAEANA